MAIPVYRLHFKQDGWVNPIMEVVILHPVKVLYSSMLGDIAYSESVVNSNILNCIC